MKLSLLDPGIHSRGMGNILEAEYDKNLVLKLLTRRLTYTEHQTSLYIKNIWFLAC